MTVERRTVLKGAAWAVPVVAVAVSTPLAAASEEYKPCVRFTNATPHLGTKNKTMYNTFELYTDCVGGVSGLLVTVTVTGPKSQGNNDHTLYGESNVIINHIPQYQSSGEQVDVAFAQLHKNLTYTVTYTATYTDSKGVVRSVVEVREWKAPAKWPQGWAE